MVLEFRDVSINQSTAVVPPCGLVRHLSCVFVPTGGSSGGGRKTVSRSPEPSTSGHQGRAAGTRHRVQQEQANTASSSGSGSARTSTGQSTGQTRLQVTTDCTQSTLRTALCGRDTLQVTEKQTAGRSRLCSICFLAVVCFQWVLGVTGAVRCLNVLARQLRPPETCAYFVCA